MEAGGIDYVLFVVSDMHNAIQFYRDVLGLSFERLILEDTWAEFDLNPGSLVLNGPGEGFTDGVPGYGCVALAANSVEAAVDDLERKGGSVWWPLEGTPVCRLAIVKDPDGNRVILHRSKDGL